ncbi:hypothetical protein ABCR94_09485 [Streptomyces sp. 21So2-11]|uniref:hypothetical protein n=1 Tax=Streptomyces sp. 21So2-11 TaxID=3144408 RepID=UPI003219C0F1
MRIHSTLTRTLAVTALAATSAMAFPASASAAPSTVPYLCPVEFGGGSYVLEYSRKFDVSAPATVRPQQTFTVAFDPEPINPRTEFNTKAWDVKFVYNLPAGAKVLSHKLVGGSNLGSSKQTVSFSPGRVTVFATGPFTAGVDADVPTLKVNLRAPAGGELTTSVAGTSATDPGFRWMAEDPTTFEIGELPCYPNPATPVVLSRTTVS